MARAIMTLIGAALLALGVWLCVIWWYAIAPFLLALVALGLVALGFIIFILGVSELTGSRPRKVSNVLSPEDDND